MPALPTQGPMLVFREGCDGKDPSCLDIACPACHAGGGVWCDMLGNLRMACHVRVFGNQAGVKP